MVTVTLKKYNSPAFPVMAEWKIGTGRYNGVYATKEEAVNYLAGRFGNVKIIDKIPEEN